MKRLSDINIGTRLTAGFALLLVFMAAITVVATTSMSANQARMDEITGVNNLKSRAAIAMRDTVHERMVALRNIALVASAAEMDDEAARIRKEAENYAQVERNLLGLLSTNAAASAEERAILEEIRQYKAQAGPLIDKAISMSRANQIDQVYATLAKELKPVQLSWIASLTRLVDLEDTYNRRATKEASEASHTARAGILVMGLIAGIAGIAVSYFLTCSLITQLGGEPAYTAGVAKQIACGDLAGDILMRKNDSVSLLHAVAAMRDNLSRIVGRVRSNTQVIASASIEIAVGNQELASRTQQQVAALKAMAESIAELAAAVRRNAESAQVADTLAMTASEVASRGSDVVGEAERKMQAINESADKIADIIGVIDDIAFQTNILALNAAVEAARAGEQGRGFAVVASEVRSLAQRSASAAREIKTLITDSVSQVQAGSELVGDAQRTMQDILRSVGRVTSLMSEISAATAAQSAGIDHINRAAAEIEGVTGQNALLVQEAAAAAGSLQQQSRQLAELVAVFQLGGMAAEPSPPPALPHRSRPGKL